MLKKVSPRNTPGSHYEISNNWMDGLADVERDGSPLVCQHCQPGTGLNAGHAGICSAFLHHIFKKQNKNQLPATERENCKTLFSISSWLPGLCAVARVSVCEITCFLCCSSREYTRGLLTSARYLCGVAL